MAELASKGRGRANKTGRGRAAGRVVAFASMGLLCSRPRYSALAAESDVGYRERGHARRLRGRLGARLSLSISLLAVVAVMATAFAAALPAAAAEPPSMEEPQPSSAECDWYGSISRTTRSYSYNTENQWSDKQFRSRAFSSTPVTGRECGATWKAIYTLDYEDVNSGPCPSTSTLTYRGEGAGLGSFSAGITGGTSEVPYYFQAYGYPDTSFPVTITSTSDSTCGEDSQSSSTGQDPFGASVSAECFERPLNVIAVAGPNVQAVVDTCTIRHNDDTNSSGTVVTSTDVLTVRFRRTTCDVTVDSDADGLGDCREYDIGTNPSNPDTDADGVADSGDGCPTVPGPASTNGCPDTDTDGDGVPDATDQCPTVPGPASTSGCPDSDSDGDGRSDEAEGAPGTDTDGDGTPDYQDADSDADGTPDSGESDNDADGDGIPDWRDPDSPPPTEQCVSRGFTVAHYDADLAAAAAPDPDFFDWDVSAAWCVRDGVVDITTADSTGRVTLDPHIVGLLAVLGVEVRHDREDDDVFLTALDATTGTVRASTDFDVCVNPLSLATVGLGGAISKLSGDLAAKILGKIPKNGTTAAAWADDAFVRIDEALQEFEENLLRQVEKFLASERRWLPTHLRTSIMLSVRQQLDELGLALRGQTETSLSKMADTSFLRFLDVYGDGQRVVVPRGGAQEARALWASIVGAGVNDVLSVVSEVLNYQSCVTIWRPILTIFIPRTGESFVDDSLVDGSIFDVKGGIAVDTRS